jgi:hypothetical protein
MWGAHDAAQWSSASREELRESLGRTRLDLRASLTSSRRRAPSPSASLQSLEGEDEVAPGAAGQDATPCGDDEGATEIVKAMAQRRAGLFADVEDEEELRAKEQLCDKVDAWLASEVGIGGSTLRVFDPTALLQFAWRMQLEDAGCDEIYSAFTEEQQEALTRQVAAQLGLAEMGLAQLSQTAAMELQSVCTHCGWLSVEAVTRLRRGWARRWAMLWRGTVQSEGAAAGGTNGQLEEEEEEGEEGAEGEEAVPAADGGVLLLYEDQESAAALAMVHLVPGCCSVAPPKSQRKNFPHALRIETWAPVKAEPGSGSVSGGAAAGSNRTKTIVAADSAASCRSWSKVLGAVAADQGRGGGVGGGGGATEGGGGRVITRQQAKQLEAQLRASTMRRIKSLAPRFAKATTSSALVGCLQSLEAVQLGSDAPSGVELSGWLRAAVSAVSLPSALCFLSMLAVEGDGPGTYGNVGQSQPVLIIMETVIVTRTVVGRGRGAEGV